MLAKQPIPISFWQGLDTKTDPKQVQIGKFLALENSIFDKGGLLQKRNGYGSLGPLPNNESSYLTTLNGNMTALGSDVLAYSQANESWVNKGAFTPISLSVLPTGRSAINQIQCDSVVASNGLVCTVYTELNGSPDFKYVIANSSTGQVIVNPTTIPAGSGSQLGAPRVFLLGGYFIIAFTNNYSGTYHLQYVAVSTSNPTIVTAVADLAAAVTISSPLASANAWDGYVVGNNLYFAYYVSGTGVRINYLTSGLALSSPTTYSGSEATHMSVTADTTSPSNPVIYASFYDSGTSTGYSVAVSGVSTSTIETPTGSWSSGATSITVSSGTGISIGMLVSDTSNPSYIPAGTRVTSVAGTTIGISQATTNSATSDNLLFVGPGALTSLMTATEWASSGTFYNVTSSAQNGSVTILFEVANTYSYDSTLPTNYVQTVPIALPSSNTTGTVGSTTTVLRSVGLASKSFIINGTIYALTEYASSLQSTYFLTDLNGNIISRFAYENGGASPVTGIGYIPYGLPQAQVSGTSVYIAYLYKDLIGTQSTPGIAPSIGGAGTSNVYTQTGINLATIEFVSTNLVASEIGANLNITGGMLWTYDGQTLNENNFNLFPDDIEVTASTTGGSMAPQEYYYQVTYEWTDAAGNIVQSAPSVPVSVNLTNAANTATFKGTFTTASAVVTVTDGMIGNLFVGQTISDTTTSGNISSGTTIASIDVSNNTITLNQNPAGDSAASPGDVLTAILTPITFTASFDEDSNFLYASTSQTGILSPGQILTDTTTSGNLSTPTYITSIDSTGQIIGISAPTLGSASADTISTTSTISATVNIPTLRLTYKSNVKIVVYRWSTANQVYYQATSVSSPTLNNPADDSITFSDTQADTSIIGNQIIYTTGGVVEDVGGPAAVATTLFDDRLWLIDAEDPNTLWFSKQVIEATPVEMSDLLTYYVAPTIGAQGSSGPMTAIFPMDDKLIIFKKDSIYFINGTGPDNTGSNSDYSSLYFITSTVGCTNQNSIVIVPTLNGSPGGLMFQSDKGIWLLGRDLSTTYIGAPVEAFNSYTVNSAIAIPGTNQVRFTLSNGVTLMYDYYYQQWGTFAGVPAISSTLYQNLHTYISPSGDVFQETPGEYLDNGNPTLMSFTTSWIALAGLQGYQRAFFFYLLGTYFTPHKLNLTIAYDYNSSPIQSTLINPTNWGPIYGSSAMPVYGQLNPYGGGSSDSGASSNIEQWRIFLKKQRCTSFQINLQEIYDPSFGEPAGQGLTLSGLNLVVGIKKGFRPQPAATSAGGGTNST